MELGASQEPWEDSGETAESEGRFYEERSVGPGLKCWVEEESLEKGEPGAPCL